MNSIDLIRMGLKNLFRRKLRTFLTTLGIIIGTISVVVMISLGIGMQAEMEKQLSQYGDLNIIKVSPLMSQEKNISSNQNNKKYITLNDIASFKQIDGVDDASPIIRYQVKMTAKNYITNATEIIGMPLDFMEKYLINTKIGRMLTPEDYLGVLFGKGSLYEFHIPSPGKVYDWWAIYYDSEADIVKEPTFNPLDYNIKMFFNVGKDSDEEEPPPRPIPIKPIGVLATESWLKSSYAYMEISQLQELKDKLDKITDYREYDGKKPKNEGYQEVYVYVPEIEKLKLVQREIQLLGFQAKSNTKRLDQKNSIMTVVQMIFGGIGAIALLVAAIGITNTMVMAINERRKEIGVMKVIGASIRDIKKLFLFEAASIGLLGGILGTILSFVLSYVINNVISLFDESGPSLTKSTYSIIPSWLIISSLAFTTLIGLVSGYLPARRAMKLSALEAIKTD